MSTITNASDDLVDAARDHAEAIEHEAVEKALDCVTSAERYSPSTDGLMQPDTHGDYLDRDEVITAIQGLLR